MSADRPTPDHVVLVDESDAPLGREQRDVAHRGEGQLHRAFTLLVLDHDDRLLLARRAEDKTLWPGCWDGTLASHPVDGEAYAEAAARRIDEELLRRGLVAPSPDHLVRFRYQARDGDRGSEHELCTALVVRLPADDVLAPVAGEIDALEWVDAAALIDRAGREPRSLCPWLLMSLMHLPRGDDKNVTDAVRRALQAWAAPGMVAAATAALADHDVGLDAQPG